MDDDDENILNTFTEGFYEIVLFGNSRSTIAKSDDLSKLDDERFVSRLSKAHSLIVRGIKGMDALYYLGKYVNAMTNLKSLTLNNLRDGREYIPEYLKNGNIDHLNLNGNFSIDDIDKFTNLSHLSLEEVSVIDDDTISKISSLSTLEIRSLVDEDQFKLPKNLRRLQFLNNNLDHVNFTNELDDLVKLRVHRLYTKIEKLTSLKILDVYQMTEDDFIKLKSWNLKNLINIKIQNLNSDIIDVPQTVNSLIVHRIRDVGILTQLSSFHNIKHLQLSFHRFSFKNKRIIFPMNVESIVIKSSVDVYLDVVNLKNLEKIVLNPTDSANISYDRDMYKYLNLHTFRFISDKRTETKIGYEFFNRILHRNRMLSWPILHGLVLNLAMVFTGLINMNMPPYVLLEIIDWLPIEQVDSHISQYYLKNNLKKIRLIESVQRSVNKIYSKRSHN